MRRLSRASVGAAGSLGGRLDATPATARLVGRRCIASTKAVFAAKRMSLYTVAYTLYEYILCAYLT